MSKTYRVAIADSEPSSLQLLDDLLRRLGHLVVIRCDSTDCLVKNCAGPGIDLVICDTHVESTANAFNRLIDQFHDIPIIITSNEVSSDFLESDASHQVFGVLLKPLREAELAAMILVAAQRSNESNQLREETSSLRIALEDRKVIEQAKGVIMKKCAMDEAGAFRQLQHMARQQRKKVVEIAQGVLIAESAFMPVQTDARPPMGDMPHQAKT